MVAEDRRLSYRELDERSNRLARHFQSLGVEAGTLVGVAMGRSETLVVSLLAILKAGGAYVPLDTGILKSGYPWIIEDSGMKVLLTTAEARQKLPLELGGITVVDAEDSGHSAHNSGQSSPMRKATTWHM